MTGVVNGILGIHAVIEEVADKLGVALGLHRASHHPEGGPEGPFSGDQARYDRVQRTLARLEGVRMTPREAERVAPVLEADAGVPRHHAAAEAHVEAVYERA